MSAYTVVGVLAMVVLLVVGLLFLVVALSYAEGTAAIPETIAEKMNTIGISGVLHQGLALESTFAFA